MKLIKAATKRSFGNAIFQVNVLYPGTVMGTHDTGLLTIGRIDHASFRPPGIVPMHPHQDDEILSYMRAGQQIHKDSTGQIEHLTDSYLMLMNAGSGISHEEIAEKDVEMLQIFMRPAENGLPPQVQFHQFADVYSINQWRLLASNDAKAPLRLRVDTAIFDARLNKDHMLTIPLRTRTWFTYCIVLTAALRLVVIIGWKREIA
jgi:redox-sensitive bicupin YhaK (pirin superfamily)